MASRVSDSFGLKELEWLESVFMRLLRGADVDDLMKSKYADRFMRKVVRMKARAADPSKKRHRRGSFDNATAMTLAGLHGIFSYPELGALTGRHAERVWEAVRDWRKHWADVVGADDESLSARDAA